jgi:hypothetical protein
VETLRQSQGGAAMRRRLDEIATAFDWLEDLLSRNARAELAFQTIGLSDERRDELIHESHALLRVMAELAAEIKSEAA